METVIAVKAVVDLVVEERKEFRTHLGVFILGKSIGEGSGVE